MREILYRAKDKNGIWHYGFPMHGGLTEGLTQIQSIHVESDGYYVHEIIPETVGQFTGLTDKNGKKIFSGDIVDILCESEEIGLIEWDKDTARFVVSAYSFMADYSFMAGFDNYYGTDLEVIGNIYDISELFDHEHH